MRLRRIPKHIRELNPELDTLTSRTAATGITDGADTLAAELRRLAPDVPAGIREYPFDRWRIDLAWPSAMLAVEVDGGQYKTGGGKHGQARDYQKTRRLTLCGWRLLRYTVAEVEADPLGAIDEIRQALGLVR